MKTLLYTLLTVIAVLGTVGAEAANIRAFEPGRKITIYGAIEKGDYEKVIGVVRKLGASVTTYTVLLDSEGGEFLEAIRIGQVIKDLYLPTAVMPMATCASSCFMILIASPDRTVIGRVGIHRPYYPESHLSKLTLREAEEHTRSLHGAVRQHLVANDVSQLLVDKMFSKASTEIYWLTAEDLDERVGRWAPWWEQYMVTRCGLDKTSYLAMMNKQVAPTSTGKDYEEAMTCAIQIQMGEAINTLRHKYKITN